MDKFLRLNPQNAEKLKNSQNILNSQNAQNNSSNIKSSLNKGSQPWVEKYRPNKLDDVVYQTSVVNALKNTKVTGKMQHLLLYGPPGTGKTSTILALAKEIFGDRYKDRVLELNASDERGIQVVRDKIKKYSQKLVTKISDKNTPNFQIVILDEADSMTNDAQSALRRVIEDYTKTTRFCFICNYVSKIIDPIASRCAKYRFSPLTRESQKHRLKYISQIEGMPVDEGVVDFLIDISEGDLRRSINLLQSISQLGNDLMTQEVIGDVCGTIPENEIQLLFETCKTQFTDSIIKQADNFFLSGYDLRQLVIQLNDYVVRLPDLNDMDKSKICEVILDTETSLMEGSSPNLQLIHLITQIRKIFFT